MRIRRRWAWKASARLLERGLEALESVAGVRPLGYRSPSGEFTLNTLALLLERDAL